MVALGAGSGDVLGMAASMANEGERIRVKGEGQETVGAKCLPATLLAERERGGAATIVIDKGLLAAGEVLSDGGEECVGKITGAGELVSGGKIDYLDVWGDSGGFGFFREGDEGRFGLGEIKIRYERGG